MSDENTNPVKKKDFLSSWQFQDYLSFGYLYLLLVGIVSDSIYYGMVGINIISYSTILDVLLSPVVRLTDNILLPVFIILLPVLGYFYTRLMMFIGHKVRQKQLDKDGSRTHKPAVTDKFSTKTIWFMFTCLIIFTTFMGYGVGGGSKQKERLVSGNAEPDTEIFYQDGLSEKVRVIGNNSEYIFFIQQNATKISVSPIKDNIRLIRELDK